MSAQLGAGSESRRPLAEHPLETEHERVADLPAVRRLAFAAFHLGEGVVERPPPGGPGGENGAGVFLRVEEGLPGPGFGSEGGGV